MDWVCSQEWKFIGDADTGGNRLVRSLTLGRVGLGSESLLGMRFDVFL